MHDARERLPDGSLINLDGSIIPPIDPDLMQRLEAAKDESGAIHDPDLANEYFEAMQKQGDEMRRLAGWVEPVIEVGSVFPSAEGEEVLPPYRDGDPPAPFIPADEDDGDGEDGSPVRVIIF